MGFYDVDVSEGIEQGFKDLKDKCKSNASITNFEENIKCFSKLYGNMTMFGKKVKVFFYAYSVFYKYP